MEWPDRSENKIEKMCFMLFDFHEINCHHYKKYFYTRIINHSLKKKIKSEFMADVFHRI